ncbi:MAG: hypothetical protein H7338_03100, partial [Candidatus Sericytochromatia bacterium]|nr:hypothetical protein [Candidatus Sericytochromatia bacterium]
MNGLTAMGPALSAADMLVTAKSPVSTSSQPAQIPTAIAAPIGPQDSAHVGLAQVHQFSIGPVGIQDVPPATGLEVQQFLSDQASVHPSAIALSGDDLLIFTPSAPPVRASMADIRTAMTPGLAASPMGQALQVFEVAHNSGLSSAPIRAILSGHQAEPAAPPPSMAETLSHVAFAVDVEIYVNSPRGLAADMSAAARFTGQAQRGVEISAILQSSPVKMRPEIIRMHQAALDGGLQVITKAFADARQTGKYDGAFDAIQSFHKLCASITESPHWQNRSATLQTTIAEAQSKRVVPVSLGSQADPNPALGLPSADHADDAVSQPSQFTPGQTPAPGLPSADHAYDAVSQPSQFTPGQTPAPSLPSADHAYDAVSQPSQFTPGQTPAVSLPPTDHAYDTVPKPPQAAQSPTLAAASDPPPTDHAYDTVPKRPQSVPAPTPAAESVPPPTDHAYDTVPKPPQAAPAPAAVTMIADKNISAESLRFAKKNQLKRPGKVGDVVLNRQGEVFKLPDPAPSRENAANRTAGQAEAPSAHELAEYTESADLHEPLKDL